MPTEKSDKILSLRDATVDMFRVLYPFSDKILNLGYAIVDVFRVLYPFGSTDWKVGKVGQRRLKSRIRSWAYVTQLFFF